MGRNGAWVLVVPGGMLHRVGCVCEEHVAWRGMLWCRGMVHGGILHGASGGAQRVNKRMLHRGGCCMEGRCCKGEGYMGVHCREWCTGEYFTPTAAGKCH